MYVRPKLTFVIFLCFFLHLPLRKKIKLPNWLQSHLLKLLLASLVQFKDIIATTGGSGLAVAGGGGQVIKADHIVCHQLDTPSQSNIIKVFPCKKTY